MPKTNQKVVIEVNRQLDKWRRLSATLGEDIDPQTVLDTLEGETDLYEALVLVAEKVGETEALAKGLEGYIKGLQERRTRLTKTAETLRNVILSAMESADIPGIVSPSITLSKRELSGKLVVEDEAKVPAKFFAPQDPKLDKKALTEALKEGEDVPGTRLSNGGISLTIRVK
jgi:hypothetical protein